jgi:16S rRNA (cytosine967-C5)-methyltransferase
VGAKRGQTVIDFCAGAGGKTLAIAAAMRNSGQIYACDISLARLQRLKPRLARSGASNVQPFGMSSEHDPKLAKLAGRAHAVLVDAPCSGTGTLRRNPDLKWRFDEENLANLNVQQASILKAASQLVRPGGALIYATCSLRTKSKLKSYLQKTANGSEMLKIWCFCRIFRELMVFMPLVL